MRFGLNVGYSGARMALDIDLIKGADRLGVHSVWTAEAYGSDAVTPLAWIAAQTKQIKGRRSASATGSPGGANRR